MNIFLMSGLPGSGKSTWLKNHVGDNGAIIHRDEVRDHLREVKHSKEYFPCSPKEEYQYWIDSVVDFIHNNPGKDIYCDQTTLSNKAANKFISELSEQFDFIKAGYDFTILVMDTPVEICQERNKQRTGFAKVPANVISKMAKSFDINSGCFNSIRRNYRQHFSIMYLFGKE